MTSEETIEPHVVVVTGMSGAGRSAAANVLEDLGYFVIDNLPSDLIADVVARSDLAQGGRQRLAVVVDTRRGLDFADLDLVMRQLAADGVHATLLFLDADDAVLVTRFEESRRPHPVGGETLAESIGSERAALEDLRGRAEVIIDTSERNVHQLREAVLEAFAGDSERRPLRIAVTSFGFKHGIPRVTDLLFDVRFLPNPHWDDELRPLTGRDGKVASYVLNDEYGAKFVDMTTDMLTFLIPRYEAEGKAYLTISFGCTGGRHRSVAIAEEVASRLGKGLEADLVVRHRDLER